MSLWGVTPLLAAALLGASPARPPAVHGAARSSVVRSAASQEAAGRVTAALAGAVSPSPKASPTTTGPGSATPPAAPALQMTSPVLKQTGADQWQTTVLLAGAGTCPTALNDYALQTTSPGGSFSPVSVNPVATGPACPLAGTPAVKALSCQVMLTFANTALGAVPASAALVIDGLSAQSLIISRSVTLFYYLGVPAIVAGVMAILLFLLTLVLVAVYDQNGKRESLFFWQNNKTGGFWRHSVSATGSWTAGDSWATNIGVVTAIIGTVIGAIPATDVLFRGVALDRFAILTTIAGVTIGLAPLVVAIRYARWLRLHPGLTDQTRVELPGSQPPPSVTVIEHITEIRDGIRFGLRDEEIVVVSAQAGTWSPATVDAPSGAAISMPGTAVGAPMRPEGPQSVLLDSGNKIQVPPGSIITIWSACIRCRADRISLRRVGAYWASPVAASGWSSREKTRASHPRKATNSGSGSRCFSTRLTARRSR